MERLLCDLKVVAALRVGDRVSQSGGALVIMHPSFFGTLWRTARGESRHTSITAVAACFTEALALGEEYAMAWKRSVEARSTDVHGAERLRERALHLVAEIESASVGLRHLKLTYADDHTLSARINVLMDKISTQSNAFKDILGIQRQKSPILTFVPPGEMLVLALPSI
jgi:hypothetical protein